MQEGQVAWEPVSIETPFYVRVYICFLIVISICLLLRCIRLIWGIYRHPAHSTQTITAAGAAKEAIFGRFGLADGLSLQTVRTEFDYQWNKLFNAVQSTRRWLQPTLLVVLGMFIWNLMEILQAVYPRRVSLVESLCGALSVACNRAVMGIALSIAILVMSNFFQSKLENRKTQWLHFCGNKQQR